MLLHGIIRMSKKKFYVYQEDLIRHEISYRPLTISQFVEELNQKYGQEDMKRLRTDTITNYLCTKKYLTINERNRKRPTTKGLLLGIRVGYCTDKKGKKYEVNLYNARAQKYILDNLYEMIL